MNREREDAVILRNFISSEGLLVGRPRQLRIRSAQDASQVSMTPQGHEFEQLQTCRLNFLANRFTLREQIQVIRAAGF